MLFNSSQFVFLFFPIVTALFFLLPHRFRWALLLGASCYFYMAFVPMYILILAVLIVVDYFAGIFIENAQTETRKYQLLVLSICANVAMLGFYKYFNFVNSNLAELARFFHVNYLIENLTFVLPIGLSFHTFQSMSYTIEVYRGNQKAERNFGIYALYVMFYPQLVAGPIERPQNLLHQFHEPKFFDYDRVVSGLRLMMVGFLKKLLIADRLSLLVDQVYNFPHQYQGFPLILATYAFAFQIYCDFSAYTDIARGCARIMGYNLMENFDRPYSATSIADFWRRWHISLLTWFRDYIYLPLVFSGERTVLRVYFSIFTVFLISGLWHGAGWTFITWGALHGLYSALALATAAQRASLAKLLRCERWPRLHRIFNQLFTFHIVLFAYIFFRANTMKDAIYIVRNLFKDLTIKPWIEYKIHAMGPAEVTTAIALVVIMELAYLGNEMKWKYSNLDSQPRWMRWSLYYGCIIAIFFLGKMKTQQFIYFQF